MIASIDAPAGTEKPEPVLPRVAHAGRDGVDAAQQRVEPLFPLGLIGLASVVLQGGDLDVVQR